MKKILFTLATLIASNNACAEISTFSRANCYVPIAEIGWESVTWGWPESKRATSSWHKKVGDPANKSKNYRDDFRVTWRSFAGASHGFSDGLDNNWEVRGKHWSAQTVPFNGFYNYANSYANDCNLNEW